MIGGGGKWNIEKYLILQKIITRLKFDWFSKTTWGMERFFQPLKTGSNREFVALLV